MKAEVPGWARDVLDRVPGFLGGKDEDLDLLLEESVGRWVIEWADTIDYLDGCESNPKPCPTCLSRALPLLMRLRAEVGLVEQMMLTLGVDHEKGATRDRLTHLTTAATGLHLNLLPFDDELCRLTEALHDHSHLEDEVRHPHSQPRDLLVGSSGKYAREIGAVVAVVSDCDRFVLVGEGGDGLHVVFHGEPNTGGWIHRVLREGRKFVQSGFGGPGRKNKR